MGSMPIIIVGRLPFFQYILKSNNPVFQISVHIHACIQNRHSDSFSRQAQAIRDLTVYVLSCMLHRPALPSYALSIAYSGKKILESLSRKAVINFSASHSTSKLSQFADRYQLIATLHKGGNNPDSCIRRLAVEFMHQYHIAIFHLA